MSRTEYDPTPHAQDVPHVQDATIPPPAPLSEDSEQRHALAAFVHVTLAVQARAMHRARAVAQAAPAIATVARVEAARRALQGGDPHAGRAGLGGQAPPGGLCGAPGTPKRGGAVESVWVRQTAVAVEESSASLPSSGAAPPRSAASAPCCCCHGASAA